MESTSAQATTVAATAAGPWGGYSNGRIPTSALTPLSWDAAERLEVDAAAAFEALNVAYRARFGVNIAVTDSYRDYDAQVRVRAEKGNLAAIPGTSNHGWALAVDLGGGINTDYTTSQYLWMDANAPAYGWVNPSWARPGPGFQKREPWHWEYTGVQVTVPTLPPTQEPDMPLNQSDLEAIDRLISGRLDQRIAQGTALSQPGLEAVHRLVAGIEDQKSARPLFLRNATTGEIVIDEGDGYRPIAFAAWQVWSAAGFVPRFNIPTAEFDLVVASLGGLKA
jgi:hypothetical protein